MVERIPDASARNQDGPHDLFENRVLSHANHRRMHPKIALDKLNGSPWFRAARPSARSVKIRYEVLEFLDACLRGASSGQSGRQ